MSLRNPSKPWSAWLAVAALLLLPTGARAQALLRWMPPADADLAGYVVYLSDGRAPFDRGQDIGPVEMDVQSGIASYDLGSLVADGEYSVALTAYDTSGNESELSNVVRVRVAGPAPACLRDLDCDDGNRCNGAERCAAGECLAGTPPSCASSTACHEGFCDPGQGCMERPLPDGVRCDDGNVTTWDDLCTAGTCLGVQCRTDADCSDGSVCTGAERCVAGMCRAGDPLVCPSAGRCSQSACDAQQGCIAKPVTCPLPGPCQTARCDEAQGCLTQSLPDGTSCDDRDPQTAQDTCQAGKCVGEVQGPQACLSALGDPHGIHATLLPDGAVEIRWRAPTRREGLPLRYRSPNGWREVVGLPEGQDGCESEYRVSLRGLESAGYDYAVGGPGPRGIVWSSIDQLQVPPIGPGVQRAAFFGSLPDTAAERRALAAAARWLIAPQVVLGGGGHGEWEGTPSALHDWIDQAAPLLRIAAFGPTLGSTPQLDSALVRHAAPNPSGTYGFDAGSIHYLAIGAPTLDALHPAGSEGREHLDTIEDDLAAAAARGMRWLVVYMHLDLYASAGTASDPRLDAVRDALGAIFERHGVDLVLSSGGPGYERTHPMVAGSAVVQTSSVFAANQGVIYMRSAAVSAGAQASLASAEAAPGWSASRATVPTFVTLWDTPRGFLVRAYTFGRSLREVRRVDGVRLR